jgi:hypothetical protein
MKNPSYLAVHVGNSTCAPRKHRQPTQWWLVLPVMLLVCGLIYWGAL